MDGNITEVSMKNTVLFLGVFFLNFIFIFHTTAQQAQQTDSPQQQKAEASADSAVHPVRSYPEDRWYQKALDGQVSTEDFIKYLNTVLLHHETGEGVWEDALNALIYMERQETSDSEKKAQLQEQVYQSFAAVIASADRTKGQRYDVLKIVAKSGAPSATEILKEFVQAPFFPEASAGTAPIDIKVEAELRWDAVGFLEDIGTDSALQALHDLILVESLDDKLKEKALDSLEDRRAYTHIREIAINPLTVPSMRSASFQIIVDNGDLQQIKEIALASSAGYEMNSSAIEELAKHKAIRLLRGISENPLVDNAVQERAFLKIIALRKERQDERQKD